MDDPTDFLAAYSRSVEAIPRLITYNSLDDYLLRGHYAEELLLLLGERASVLSKQPSCEVVARIVEIDRILLTFQEALVDLLGIRVGDLLTSPGRDSDE